MRQLAVKFLPFALGFILAALLFSAWPLSAQTGKTMPANSSAYVTQAVQRLNTLQIFYATNNDFIRATGALTDVEKIHLELNAITKEMDKQAPPMDLSAYHSQFLFAAQRCENLAIFAESVKDISTADAFSMGPLYVQKENCVNQLQDARLRLIDYASSYGVDVSKSIQVTTTIATPITTPSTATKVSGRGVVDQLGVPYEIVEIDPNITLAGWETYENSNGYWSVSGTVKNKHSTDRFSSVDFKVRFYKGQRLIQVVGISAGGRWVSPGQSLPFEFTSSVMPKEFERYTIEATIGGWNKTP